MIIGVIGKRGSGKTITMVKEAVDLVRKGRTIYTNFGINKQAFTEKQQQRVRKLSDKFFKEYANMKLHNCGVFLDEVYVYIDSRASMNKRNQIMSYFFNQTRKRGVDLFYSTQFFHQVDRRLRDNTELFIFPEKKVYDHDSKQIIDTDEKINTRKQTMIVTCTNLLLNERRRYKEVYDANPYFRYYDTDEIIDFELK